MVKDPMALISLLPSCHLLNRVTHPKRRPHSISSFSAAIALSFILSPSSDIKSCENGNRRSKKEYNRQKFNSKRVSPHAHVKTSVSEQKLSVAISKGWANLTQKKPSRFYKYLIWNSLQRKMFCASVPFKFETTANLSWENSIFRLTWILQSEVRLGLWVSLVDDVLIGQLLK